MVCRCRRHVKNQPASPARRRWRKYFRMMLQLCMKKRVFTMARIVQHGRQTCCNQAASRCVATAIHAGRRGACCCAGLPKQAGLPAQRACGCMAHGGKAQYKREGSNVAAIPCPKAVESVAGGMAGGAGWLCRSGRLGARCWHLLSAAHARAGRANGHLARYPGI